MSNRTLNLYQHSLWVLLASLFECEGSLYFPCRLLTVQISSRDRVSSLSCQYWRGHLLQAQKWRELISFLSFSEAHRLCKKSSVKFLPLLFSSPVQGGSLLGWASLLKVTLSPLWTVPSFRLFSWKDKGFFCKLQTYRLAGADRSTPVMVSFPHLCPHLHSGKSIMNFSGEYLLNTRWIECGCIISWVLTRTIADRMYLNIN